MPHLDLIAPAAREIGAVNTIVLAGDELHGYNTDAAAALAPVAGVIELRGAHVAIIGAGGAARALLWGLQHASANVTLYARDVARAQTVAAQFGARVCPLAGARFADFDLVVNATPLGTRGPTADETPADAAQLRGARVAYDLIYNPAETRFMRESRAAGCAQVLGGLPMLVAQAAAQFELWTGQPAPHEVMLAAAEKQLGESGTGI
jgi:shikimate dehydrogenase